MKFLLRERDAAKHDFLWDKLEIYKPLRLRHFIDEEKILERVKRTAQGEKNEIARRIKLIGKDVVPSTILQHLIRVCRIVYGIVGREESLDAFNRLFLYFIVKHAGGDFFASILLAEEFIIREVLEGCIDVPKEEAVFYLVNCRVVLENIERMEYKDLHIGEEEYNSLCATYGNRNYCKW